MVLTWFFFFQAEDGIRDLVRSRGLGDVYKRQPNGYYNIERMLKLSTRSGTRLLLCGSCLDARGLKNIELVDKAEISTMAELTKQISESDKGLTF